MASGLPDSLGHLAQRMRGNAAGYLALITLALALVLGAVAPQFLTIGNFVALLESYSVTMIFAVGLLVVLIAGGIDISFAATATVAQYLAAAAATRAGWPPALAIGTGLLAGTALGLVNAVLIHYLRIASIVAAVAMMSVSFSFLMFFTGGRSIYNLPDWWTDPLPASIAAVVPVSILVALLMIALTAFILRHTVLGRQVFAMGGSLESARRLGVSIAGIHLFAYGYLGFCAAVAGLVQAQRVEESVPNALFGTELGVLAAAVLGGARLMGGSGSVAGVVLGVVLLAMLQNGLNLLGISSYVFDIVIGAVILGATSVTGLSERVGLRRTRRVGQAEA